MSLCVARNIDYAKIKFKNNTSFSESKKKQLINLAYLTAPLTCPLIGGQNMADFNVNLILSQLTGFNVALITTNYRCKCKYNHISNHDNTF